MAAVLGLSACGEVAPTAARGAGTARATVRLQLAALDSMVRTLTITVSATDIDTALRYNLVVNPAASSPVATAFSIPAGPQRRFRATAFRNSGDSVAAGEDTVDLVAGSNVTVGITLYPLGQTVGTDSASVVALSLSPVMALVVTGTQANPFTATARRGDSSLVFGVTPVWASFDPAVARSSAGGAFAGVQPGSTIVSAFTGQVGATARLLVASWDSATATSLDTVSGCDDCAQAVDLPFAFPFFGVGYPRVWVTSNGYAALQPPGGIVYSGTQDLLAVPAGGTLAPLYTDLAPNLGGGGLVDRVVASDHVSFTWRSVPLKGQSTQRVTVQTQLWSDGRIVFAYLQLPSVAFTHTVGISVAGTGSPSVYPADFIALSGSSVVAPALAGIGQQFSQATMANRIVAFFPIRYQTYAVTTRRLP